METPVVCTCPKTKCVRHQDCAKCEEYHRKKNNSPYCRRENGLWGKLFSK